jgi:hypothetical protein
MILLSLALGVGACATSAPAVPRYLVTATPIDVLGTGHPGLCVAVDPADAHGVWWWEPGPSGCSTRTTGPTVFRGEDATVVASQGSGVVAVQFRLQLTSGFRDVSLEWQGGVVHVSGSASRIATARRADLDIPPAYGR